MVGHADESFTLVDLANVTAVDVDPRYATRRQKSAPKKKRRSN
jgi:hypothetical protein